ncbi:MAG TPA: hypothetical protein VI248_01770 [Kineosporiaceae bacterium]
MTAWKWPARGRRQARQQRRLDRRGLRRARRVSRRAVRRRRWVARWLWFQPYSLAVLGLGAFTVAGFLWHAIAGCVVLGVAFLALEWRVHGR